METQSLACSSLPDKCEVALPRELGGFYEASAGF